MPRKRRRRDLLRKLHRQVSILHHEFIKREILDEYDSDEDERYFYFRSVFRKVLKNRYIYRESKYRDFPPKFDLEATLRIENPRYTDEEFLCYFRMSRESFFLLLDEIKDTNAFKQISNARKQRPVAYQLLVYLYRVGREGTGGGCLQVCGFFGISKGSVTNYVRRCVNALLELKEEIVFWPNEKERIKMRNRLALRGFRHCVGIIDGTLVELSFRPLAYHECYYSRKCMYALNVMVVCDDNCRIIYYNAGWPGSTHDNRVLRNSQLYYNRGDYFSQKEYLLGDSAYSASTIMVQSFKKRSGTSHLPAKQEAFNNNLAKIRIRSEHCIGQLKGRFQCLKKNNIKLKNSKEEVKEMVDLIGSCIVLHNLLIDYDEEEIPAKWFSKINKNIDWSLYDEEEEDIADINEHVEDRRKYVYNSFINNYIV
jgi:hypothetical protein